MVEEALQTGSIAAVVVLLPVTYALLRSPADASSGRPVATNGSGGIYVGGPELLQPVFSTALSAGVRLVRAVRNKTIWSVVFTVTVALVAVLNAVAFDLAPLAVSVGLLPTAAVALFTYAVMLVGTYSAVSMRTQGNAMAVGACTLALGLVLLVAISGHLYFLQGSGSSPVNA